MAADTDSIVATTPINTVFMIFSNDAPAGS